MTETIGGNSATIPPTDRSTSIPWADQAVDQTVAGSGTATQSWGFEFSQPGDSQEIQCSWIVPTIYDNVTGNIPQVTLMGWSITDEACIFDEATRYVELSVESRAYAAGDRANAPWLTQATNAIGFACTPCGGIDCRPSDIVKSITIDACPGLADWAPDNLVFIKITRIQSSPSSSDLQSPFHLSRVRLTYSDTDP